jgi:transcriptional antiterminator
MFMDTYVLMFLKHLNKIDNRLGMLFYALVNDNLTHSEIAKYMDCSTKTVQRKLETIKQEWKKI